MTTRRMEDKISHTTRLNNVSVRDIAALRAAVEQINAAKGLNLSVKENSTCRMYFAEDNVPCDVVVHVPGCRFDLGFRKTANNTYEAVFDAHGGELARFLGGGQHIAKTDEERKLSNIGGLMQAYTQKVLETAAMNNGFSVYAQHDEATGNLIMQIA